MTAHEQSFQALDVRERVRVCGARTRRIYGRLTSLPFHTELARNETSFHIMRNFILAALGLVAPILHAADTKPTIDPNLAKEATVGSKAFVHVVFTEVLESKRQRDWTDTYNATVELLHGDKRVGQFRGSTLPNDRPPSESPKYEYSVVLSTGALKPLLGDRFFRWEKTLRADGRAPCLRLAGKVPTLNVGTARDADKFVSFLVAGAIKGSFFYAENILVHSGHKERWRGSAGCLTIHPDDAAAFFAAIPDNAKGTLAVHRGLHDFATKTSYSY